MVWPSRSPDLNPMESLWGILDCKVYTHNRQFSSIEHLKKTVSKVWSKNGPVNLETLSMNMAERTFK
uniref:DDE_3 domain-containing protein n=1 Tax=Heterorhabditis bacteriophora TaxID=37862 RepID=A0A1I7WQT0_HETBA